MIYRKPLNYINQFFSNISKKFKTIYLSSKFYDKKISKIYYDDFRYKPSPYLLSSIIKYQKKKYKIEDFAIESISQKNLTLEDFEKLNNFFWFFSLDLKSSKKATQNVIENWIKNNEKYNSKSWDFDLTSKRIIAWLSNHQLTYEDSNKEYQDKFNLIVQKQTNHLINEAGKSDLFENKMIGSAAIILVGLSYQDQKNYLSNGLDLLKNIIKSSLDAEGFPKSRSIKQLVFYLKYFILIREWFKESQTIVPEYIDETIYYLGQGYSFTWQNINQDILFNGNTISNNSEFDQYLIRLGYKFKNESNELGGYVHLKNKKLNLVMDVGINPKKDFSKDYQSGALSFEIISNGKKLITNSGYFPKKNKLNALSKMSASHNTLIIDDHSSCKFEEKKKFNTTIEEGLKIIKKNIIFEKNYWKISAAHDGYLNKYNSIHEREIEFYPDQTKFIGVDKIIKKNFNYNIKFDIRFHLEPNIKLMKTQDNKSILIELNNEGWKFSCNNFDINIDNGLYFGNKNSYMPNQNIFISGISYNQNESIKWEITKI
ncbi:MAG: heparinase [Pelagibacteraceae bacterium]|nr:heparinase [Pelagibacteraceae bacterium]